MRYEIEKAEAPEKSIGTFAIGQPTGTLYFVEDITASAGIELTGIVIIGRGMMAGKEGKTWPVGRAELLPPGTKIIITT